MSFWGSVCGLGDPRALPCDLSALMVAWRAAGPPSDRWILGGSVAPVSSRRRKAVLLVILWGGSSTPEIFWPPCTWAKPQSSSPVISHKTSLQLQRLLSTRYHAGKASQDEIYITTCPASFSPSPTNEPNIFAYPCV